MTADAAARLVAYHAKPDAVSEDGWCAPSDPVWTNAYETECRGQADLLRDIFGNPFRPATLDPPWLAWNDGTIPKLAQAIYDERALPSGHLDVGRLAILADALEDAGCTSTDILNHCRSPRPHVRGCWVVDLLLGKQ